MERKLLSLFDGAAGDADKRGLKLVTFVGATETPNCKLRGPASARRWFSPRRFWHRTQLASGCPTN